MIYQALAILDMTSTLFAIYGNIVLLGMAQGQAHNNLKKKFYVLKGVLLLRNLQQIIISILVSTGVVVCSKMLDVTAQSKRKLHRPSYLHLTHRGHQMNVIGPYWWQVHICSGNGLVPSGNKPLPEPMLT